ncbi:hypothetical protein JCM8547_005866 [Rhodosporidiobolus lusitaniae]
MPPRGLSSRAKELVKEGYEERDQLPPGTVLARAIRRRIKDETGEVYAEDQINHVMRHLPGYQTRAAGPIKRSKREHAVGADGEEDPYEAVARLAEEPQFAVFQPPSSSAFGGNPLTGYSSSTAPHVIYQNHEWRILHPDEVFQQADGSLVDAEGYPVTVQQV